MSEIQRMIVVGKHRGFDGAVASYDLKEYGDEKEIVKNYSVEYLIEALKHREMVIYGLKLNPLGTGIVAAPHEEKHYAIDDDEDDMDDTQDNSNNGKKKLRRKHYRSKKSTHNKKKHK